MVRIVKEADKKVCLECWERVNIKENCKCGPGLHYLQLWKEVAQ